MTRCDGPWSTGTRRPPDFWRCWRPMPAARTIPTPRPMRCSSSSICSATKAISARTATLCRLMLDEDRLNAALGDTACVETLKGVLIKCFDGDVTPLREVIESTAAEFDHPRRGAARARLAGARRTLARAGTARLSAPSPDRDAAARTRLHLVQPGRGRRRARLRGVHGAIPRNLIEDGLVPEEWLTLAEFPDLLATGDPTARMVCARRKSRRSTMSSPRSPNGHGRTITRTRRGEPAPEPYINPLRHVGRNDPCPVRQRQEIQELSSGGGMNRPNIVFIMADDLGYADVSCNGRRDYATPNIDRIAERGVRLPQAYANSAVCSATRLALITGRYQYRLPLGLEEPLAGKTDVGLPPEHPTLPSLLRDGRLRHHADRQVAPGRAAEIRSVAKWLRSFLGYSHWRDRLLLAQESARRGRSVGWRHARSSKPAI